jgi:hypothetical protein
MKLNENILRVLIEEELSDVLMAKGSFGDKKKSNINKKLSVKKKDDDKESDTERKRRIFGHEDLDKLSRGIVETDDDCPHYILCDTETGECEPTHFLRPKDAPQPHEEEDLEELNQNHDDEGRFSSDKAATCKSSYFVDKVRKSEKGSLSDKSETGRGTTKTGQGRYRCKDNSLKWESKYRMFVESVEKKDSPHDESVVAPRDTYECSKKLQQQKVLLRKMKKLVADAKEKGMSNCPLSYEDAVKIINQLEKASKGKAFEPEG